MLKTHAANGEPVEDDAAVEELRESLEIALRVYRKEIALLERTFYS